eukprot:7895787-Pyramimonas_sp.AAC.1
MPHVGPAPSCLVSGPARAMRRLVARTIPHGGSLGAGFQASEVHHWSPRRCIVGPFLTSAC